MDILLLESWLGHDIKKGSHEAYMKYLEVDVRNRRSKVYRVVNSLVKKGYMEKMYNEPLPIRYKLKNRYNLM